MLKSKRKIDQDVLYVPTVPKALKKRFKAHCAQRGISMSEAIIELMRAACSRAGVGSLVDRRDARVKT